MSVLLERGASEYGKLSDRSRIFLVLVFCILPGNVMPSFLEGKNTIDPLLSCFVGMYLEWNAESFEILEHAQISLSLDHFVMFQKIKPIDAMESKICY